MYFSRKHGGLKLKKLGELAAVDYGSVSMALQRLEQQRQLDGQLARYPAVESDLFNVDSAAKPPVLRWASFPERSGFSGAGEDFVGSLGLSSGFRSFCFSQALFSSLGSSSVLFLAA